MIISENSSSKAELRASGTSYLASVLSGKKLKIDDLMMEEEPKLKPPLIKATPKARLARSTINDDLIRLKKLTCNQPRYDHEPKWMKLKKFKKAPQGK
jgi:hypothetical protein